jgi:hypothetical protein
LRGQTPIVNLGCTNPLHFPALWQAWKKKLPESLEKRALLRFEEA